MFFFLYFSKMEDRMLELVFRLELVAPFFIWVLLRPYDKSVEGACDW